MFNIPVFNFKQAPASKGTRFHIWGVQAVGSGAPRDVSGMGNHGTINGGTTDAALWTNAGWMTTAGIDNQGANAAGGGVTIGGGGAGAVGGFNLYDEQSVIIVGSVVANMQPHNMGFIGNSAGGTPGFSIGQQANTGGLSVSLRDNSGGIYNPAVENQFALAAGALRKFCILINGNKSALDGVDTPARTMRIFGEVAGGSMTELTLANGGSIAAVVNSTLPSYGYGLGHTGLPSASGTFGARLRGQGLTVLPKGFFPKSPRAVAAWYSWRPDLPIPEALAGY